ncbi:CLUMA_CG007589, isoform A [Clunio marinus]|uniref:CLUMA_CG007589, isoform A n=1 Tax=Clunio marinus TaxID=568069 RepID=A0A1J1I2S4_9DIPT|nr:CLUMA_CG007589, isoform A [Clunio marinus]
MSEHSKGFSIVFSGNSHKLRATFVTTSGPFFPQTVPL